LQKTLETKDSNSIFTLSSYDRVENTTGVIPVDSFSIAYKGEQSQKRFSISSLKSAFLSSLISVGLSHIKRNVTQPYRTSYTDGTTNVEKKSSVLSSHTLTQTRAQKLPNTNFDEAWTPLHNFYHGRQHDTFFK
jgi:hypothetical protein